MRKYLIWLIAILLSLTQVSAQHTAYGQFYHYTTKDGLISNRIFDLAQDSAGFIWASTDFGLERFDGKLFKHYQEKDYPGLGREDVLCARALGKNMLMIGGYNGQMAIYDGQKDVITDIMPEEFQHSFFKATLGLYHSAKDEYYALTEGGLFLYKKDKRRFTDKHPMFKATKNICCRSLYIDNKRRFWIGSSEGLYVFSSTGKLLKKFDGPDSGRDIYCLISTPSGKLAVISYGGELWFFDTQKNEIENTNCHKTPFKNSYKCLIDQKDRVWIATDGYGLWYSDNLFDSNFNFTQLNPYGASKDAVKKIYALTEDHNGNIWFGTQNSGLWKYVRDNNTGIYFSEEFGFPALVCTSFIEDNNGNLLICTDGNGIYKMDINSKRFQKCNVKDENVVTICSGFNNDFYLATWGNGIVQINPETGASNKIDFGLPGQNTNDFFYIGKNRDNTLWCGSGGEGIYAKHQQGKWSKLDIRDGIQEDNDGWILKQRETPDGSHWIISSVDLWMSKNGKFKSILSTKNSRSRKPTIFYDMDADNSNNICLSTSKGVFLYQTDGKGTLLDFVPKGDYQIVQKGDNNKFWLAGSKGIVCLSLKEKKCTTLPGDYSDKSKYYFTIRSGYSDKNGNIYIGTNAGFIMFNPDEINSEKTIEYLAFDDLYILDKKILPGEDVLKDGRLNDLKQLELSNDQTDIAIGIDLIDYAELSKAIAQYRLKGYSNTWQKLPEDHTIRFSHIPAGTYTLEVKAFRNGDETQSAIISMELIVLPPWWATWWFRIFMILAIIAAIVTYISHRIKEMRRQQEKLRKKVAERTKELSKALSEKNRLISVIAHDLKNPMFAIESGLATLKSEDKNSENKIDELHESAKTLQQKMLQLLDWAKSGKEEIGCHPSNMNTNQSIESSLLILDKMIKDKQLSIEKHLSATCYAYADQRMVDTIVQNLLSNAIKFTPYKGAIRIETSCTEDEIQIKIADNGVGMNPDQLNDLKQKKRHNSTEGTEHEQGTGLGFNLCQDYVEQNDGRIDIESEVGKGTTFTVYLPSSGQEIVEEEDESTEATESLAEEPDIIKGSNILVVDDSRVICDNIASMLSKYADISTAYDGKQGLELALKNIPDIILTDVEMPEMNGITMSKKLSENEDTNHIPILFVSARTEESDRLMGLLSGAVDYINKPFSQEELIAKVCNILRLRQRQQQRLLKELMQKKARHTGIRTNREGNNESTEQDDKELNPFLQKYVKLISKHYSNSQLSIEQLAQEMAVSQPTLNRKIKALSGSTPLDLLNDYRLTTANELLSDDEKLSIAEISYKVGYNDPSYFSRKYKEKFGYSPSEKGQNE